MPGAFVPPAVSDGVAQLVAWGALGMALVGLVVRYPAVVFDVRSDLLVAAATLVTAAVFQPLRRWVQNAVDRRFNRPRYDAARTLEAFAAGLRGATDLADMERNVHGVLRRSVQPAHVTLWLASSEEMRVSHRTGWDALRGGRGGNVPSLTGPGAAIPYRFRDAVRGACRRGRHPRP